MSGEAGGSEAVGSAREILGTQDCLQPREELHRPLGREIGHEARRQLRARRGDRWPIGEGVCETEVLTPRPSEPPAWALRWARAGRPRVSRALRSGRAPAAPGQEGVEHR